VDHAKRRNLKLAVACNLIGDTYIQELTGTDYDGHQQETEYHTAAGNAHSSMGAEEYCDFLQQA
jgi:hypothetical protein